ncbi:MAG: class I adenylate-forming enzyme family protein [Pseudomonadales bacterium]
MKDVLKLDQMLERAVAQFGDRDALVFPDTRHSYQSLWDSAWQRARALNGLGVAAGDHVGLLMPNCPEYIEWLLGTALCGAVAVPINARNRAKELAYVVHNADLVGLVTSDAISEYVDFEALLGDALPGLAGATNPEALQLADAPQLRFAVMLGERASGFVDAAGVAAAVQRADDAVLEQARSERDVHAPVIMMYTSGTTADPKGCPLSHYILVRNGMAMNRTRYLLSAADRFWTPLPMFHMSSILPMVCCFDAGAATLSMRRFDAGQALQMLAAEQATVAFPAFPTIMNDLLHHPDYPSTDLSAIKRINNVAPPDVLRGFQEAMPQAVQTGAYGLTEVGGVIAFNHPDEPLETRLTRCGTPFEGVDVRIVDPEHGAVVAVGERGEIQVRGYAVFEGYYRAPEKNAEAFSDGWFCTGDLGSVDAQGSIAFHGRLKDMLKVGGENVAALEIESHLSTHEAIKLAAVIGVPDDRLGEVPAAFIELVPGAQLTAEQAIAHCKGAIAGFKVPRHVRFVTDWPMSSTKIQKFHLLDWFHSGQSSTGA